MNVHSKTVYNLVAAVVGTVLIGARSMRSNPPIEGSESNALRGRAASFDESSREQRFWLEKTARILRNGHGLGPEDDVEALLKLSKDEIVTRFMGDSRFADTLLDFNTYFLGFRLDDVRAARGYHANIFSYTSSSAISATKEAMVDGDYFKLFDFSGDLYPEPMKPLEPSRASRFAEIVKALETELKEAKRAKSASAVCKSSKIATVEKKYSETGIPKRLLTEGPLADLFSEFKENCRSSDVKVAKLAATLETGLSVTKKFFAELLKFESSSYQPKKIADIRALDFAGVGYKKPWLTVGFAPAFVLRNSSTNMNRKRSAYALKTFFCDDLTPVGTEDASQHATSGPHGSSTSCFACHYKLDPMAGFFRDLGASFKNYSSSKTLTFDDEVETDRLKYNENWFAAPDAGRKWNVGYIRSTKSIESNSYGESLDDLSTIIRTAPEAKRCLTKRLFEYFVGEQQTIDAGYLDLLTEQLTNESVASSSRAVKNTIRRLLLSKTFGERDIDPNKCYDVAPGQDVANSPPCRVAAVFAKNCAACHSSTSGAGSLDLTKWMTLPDGTMSFPHLKEDGSTNHSARTTLTRLLMRLSSSDPEVRMPYMTDMPSQERQELYLWATDRLGSLPPEANP